MNRNCIKPNQPTPQKTKTINQGSTFNQGQIFSSFLNNVGLGVIPADNRKKGRFLNSTRSHCLINETKIDQKCAYRTQS